jgi:hypothetical protein
MLAHLPMNPSALIHGRFSRGPALPVAGAVLGLSLWLTAPDVFAQDVQSQIKDREAHQQRVEVVKTRLDEQGNTISETNSYVQLETGLNFRNSQGEWEETKVEFELVPEGAIAWKGQHRVSLAGNLNTAEAVQLRLPDGALVSGHVLGLAYYDSATGESVLIGSVKDSDGWQVTPNQIVYPDAFEGVGADVRYTFTKDGFEQDVILREAPKAPTAYGFNPATTRLEVWTEFTQAPEPEIKVRPPLRAGDDEEDESLHFGSMQVAEGRAFLLGEETARANQVHKRWLRTGDGRRFLVEAVKLPEVAAALESLPPGKGGAAVPTRKAGSRMQALNRLPVKAKATRPTAVLPRTGRQDLVAAYQKPGLVVDYQFTLPGDRTNFVFQSDTTYYVAGNYNLYGTTTLEGGAVVKFAKYVAGSVDPRLNIQGPLVCQTSRYRPAVFTAKDDNSVGETISGSTGTPGTDLYANYALRVLYTAAATKVEHVRFCNQIYGLSFSGSQSNTVFNGQFVNCKFPLQSSGAGTLGAYNLLVDTGPAGSVVFDDGGVANAFYGEQATLHAAAGLRSTTAGTSLTLKNSLVMQVTNVQSYGGSNNQQASSASGVFQTALGGKFYLAAGSPHRNAGTSSLESTLGTELKQLTTHPPTELSGNFTLPTTLSPRAPRDTDVPDLGYHYASLDYYLSGRSLSSTLTLTNGVALAAYGANAISLGSGAVLQGEGVPQRLNRLVRYQNVQEQPTLFGSAPAELLLLSSLYGTRPVVRLRFTEVAVMGGTTAGRKLLDTYAFYLASLSVADSQLGGTIVGLRVHPSYSGSGYTVDAFVTNNVVQRGEFTFDKTSYGYDVPLAVNLWNNLFYGGQVNLKYDQHATYNPAWTVKDNHF